MSKQAYKVANWSEYNRSLKARGSFHLWFTSEAQRKWLVHNHPKRSGRRRKYSDQAIECLMTLKSLFRVPYRALEGMAASLMHLGGIALPIPSFQQIQRRALTLKLSKRRSKKRPTDIVIDGSGLKIYGEGEWQQERKKTKKEWKKIHVAMDPETGEIIMEDVTESSCHDSTVLPRLLRGCGKRLQRVYADGAYDTYGCYKALGELDIEPHIPPRRGAITRADRWLASRNRAIRQIVCLGGDQLAIDLWKKLTGYGKRSHVEGAFSRFKRQFGERFYSRKAGNQRTEASIKWQILNRFTQLGRPLSYAV